MGKDEIWHARVHAWEMWLALPSSIMLGGVLPGWPPSGTTNAAS